jgi:hypothetical protein
MENFYTDNPHLRFHLTHPLMARIVKLKEADYTQKDTYDFAPLDFEDAIDSYDKIMEIIGEISGEIIAPNAESVDKDGPRLVNNEVKYAPGTQQNHDALVKAGLVGFMLPREYDGLNMPHVPYIMSGEIVSRADAGFANIWGLQDCAETILEFASDELKAEFLPRFNKGARCRLRPPGRTAESHLRHPQALLVAGWCKTLHYQRRCRNFACPCPVRRRNHRCPRTFPFRLRPQG